MFATRDSLKGVMKAKYDEVFDHDGDKAADGDTVDECCATADRELRSLLFRKGLDEGDLNALAEHPDPVLISAATWMAADLGCRLKPHMVNEQGQTIYSAFAKSARESLDEIAKHRKRLSEVQTGAPSTTRGITITDLSPPFEMAPSARYPRGRGGFALPLFFALLEIAQRLA